jgi:hypothetical protein
MYQRFQDGLLNDVVRHFVVSGQTANYSIKKWKMLCDALRESLLPGHLAPFAQQRSVRLLSLHLLAPDVPIAAL